MPEILSYANWIEIPHDGTERAWVDFDLDSVGCPADTIGVLCYYIREEDNATNANNRCGIRPNGSSDTFNEMWEVGGGHDGYHRRYMMACGCDGNKLIETYRSSVADMATAKLVIFGWIKSGEAVLLTNTVLATGSVTAGSWSEVNFDSAITSGSVNAWILRVGNGHWNSDSFQPRPAGSSYSDKTSYSWSSSNDVIVGPGTNDRVDVWVDDTTNYVIAARGYFTTGYTDLHNSPQSYKPGSTGSWQTMDLSASVPANAFVFTQSDSSSSGSRVGVREVGSADDDIPVIGSGPSVQLLPVDASSRLEVFNRYPDSLCWVTGYFESGPAAVPPTYPDIEDKFGEYVSRDLSVGWTDHDPTGFSGINIPLGIVLGSDGMAVGHPHPPAGDTTYELEFNRTCVELPAWAITLADEWTLELDVFSTSDTWDNNLFSAASGTSFGRLRDTFAMNWGGGGVYNFPTLINTMEVWQHVRVYFPGNSQPPEVTLDDVTAVYPNAVGTTETGGSFFVGSAFLGATNGIRGRIKNVKLYLGDSAAPGSVLTHYYPLHDNSNTIADKMENGDGTIATIGSGQWTEI